MKKINPGRESRGDVLIYIVIIIFAVLVLGAFHVFQPATQTQNQKQNSVQDLSTVQIFGDKVSRSTATSRTVQLRLTYVPPALAAKVSMESPVHFPLATSAYAANCNPSGGIDPNTWTLIEAYTCDPGNPGAAGQEWACFGNDGTPKAIKFSEDVSDAVRCPVPTNVCLPGCCGGASNACGTCPNGQICRIANGACSSGLSCDPTTGSAAASAYGMQIDIRDPRKVPSIQQLATLGAQWVRFIFPCTNVPQNGANCPNDYHSVNLINSLPMGVKKLAVITGDSTWNAPIGSTDVDVWKRYIDYTYVPALRQIVDNYGTQLNAVELWNEEDINDGPSYDPYIPPQAFAYLVSQGANAVKSINSNIKIVVGGLASGNNTYIHEVYQVDNMFAAEVDAIAVHPYNPPPTINHVSVVMNDLYQETLADHINRPIWVTEIGIQEFTNATFPKNQKDLLVDVFNQFDALYPQPQFVNWYAFSDLMPGVGGGSNWGLVDQNGAEKNVGTAFYSYASASTSSLGYANPYPTYFRVANSSADLQNAPVQVMNQNGQVIYWQLPPGNGLKTVYAQFEVNGVWQDPISSTISLQAS